MERPWFKPKRYGFGAYPASWQGWALTAVYVLAMAALSAWLIGDAAQGEPRLTTFAALTTAITGLFVFICWRTTEGGWRWRWGEDEKR